MSGTPSQTPAPEEEIRQRTEEYRVLHEVAKILHKAHGLKPMLKEALHTLTRFKELEVEYKAGIFLADEEEAVLRLFCTVGEFTDEFMEKEAEIPFGACLCGRVAVSGEMLVSDSCFTDSRHEHTFNGMTAHGHYIVPLKTTDRMVGVLFLYTDENPPWYVRSQEILMSIGGLMADAIVSRQREEQIEDKNRQLEELNQLKNKFLGIASHDLRNPLYLIRSFSELMRDGAVGEVNTKQREMLEKMFRSSEFMKALLENLLDISKIESGGIQLEMEVQDFNDPVRSQQDLFQLLAQKKNIQLKLNLGRIPPLAFDKSAMLQVMSNFIGNAIKFSPPATTVHITTENHGDFVRFSVKDQGPGIPKEEQGKLFGEFQTLSAKPTGGEKSTGLGLAIAKKLVRLHGGEVGATSEPGDGATFYFTLPLD